MVDGASAANVRPQVVALVPMRHDSERVPGKNYRPLSGRPLYTYILETLLSCTEVDRVVVDTDSPVIRKGVEVSFPEIVLLDRPERLRGGNVPMNEVLAYDVSQVPSAFYLQTHSTNPLLKPATISRAIARFFAEYPEHDSLFSVTPLQARLWDAEAKPINHDPAVLLNTQDLPTMFVENSCLYLFEQERFVGSGNRMGERPLMFEIGPEEALDIDSESDFRVVESVIKMHGPL